ncbi:MAG: serine/threonine-protein kinase [Cyanobacteria bacterium P01_D01_bin.123]
MSEVLLRGRYRVTNLLGGGGFSRTYLALDTQLPDCPDCVVKQLKPPRNDPKTLAQARRLFQIEAKTLRSLHKHDRIPELLAFFEDERQQNFYMVQEFIPGKTFKQILAEGHRLTEALAFYLLTSVLRILDVVHAQNIIHLDIKPSNLIHRQTDNAIVLIDFGAVKQVSTQIVTENGATVQTAAIGTPGYMPCEQSYGRPKFSSDLYALGMVVIQALTGCHPTKLREDLRTGDVIWQDRVSVGPEFAEVLSTMVRYHFGHRYHSAREALAALEEIEIEDDGGAEWIGVTTSSRAKTSGRKAVSGDDNLSAKASPPQSSTPKPTTQTQASVPASFRANGRSPVNHVSPAPDRAMAPLDVTAVAPAAFFDATLVAPAQPPSAAPPTQLVVPRSLIPRRTLWPEVLAVVTKAVNQRPVRLIRSLGLGQRVRASWQSSRSAATTVWRSPQVRARTATATKLAAATLGAGMALYGTVWTIRLASDRLTLARAVTQADTDLAAAIATAGAIAPSSPVFARADSRIQTWEQVLQDSQTLERAQVEAETDLAAAISLVTSIPVDSPSRAEADILSRYWQEKLADSEQLERVTKLVASSQSANFASELAELQLISTDSELYGEATRQSEKIMVLMLERSSDTLGKSKPVVHFEDRRITVTYSDDWNARLRTDGGMRRFAVATMSVLRAQYQEFDQLVVYPRERDVKTTLDVSAWVAYKSGGNLTQNQLFEKMPIEKR